MALVKRVDRITERTTQLKFYSDFNTSFSVTSLGDIQLQENEQSVIQAIHNIVLTNQGERVYNPLFGCDIRSLLFEPASPHTEGMIASKIKTAIENFEPRARLHDVVIQGDVDENAYTVTIIFSVINRRDPISLDLVITRIR